MGITIIIYELRIHFSSHSAPLIRVIREIRVRFLDHGLLGLNGYFVLLDVFRNKNIPSGIFRP